MRSLILRRIFRRKGGAIPAYAPADGTMLAHIPGSYVPNGLATAQRLSKIGKEMGAHRARGETKTQMAGALLAGKVTLFGKRVELVWPDGLPDGFTEENLKEFGLSMLGEVSADVRDPQADPG